MLTFGKGLRYSESRRLPERLKKMAHIILFNKNILTTIISFIKIICSALFVGFIAVAGIALVIYTFMILEELISSII